jgi:membrane-bound lytic murein transglycosylase D
MPVLQVPADAAVPGPDSLDLGQVDPDSAADARILEQLATAHPEPQDTGNEEGAAEAVPGGANAAATAEVTYDIDVSTYGSHARVQYYLDFFQGPARERFSIWLQRMPRYEVMIRGKLRENGVPEDMVYLALIESGFSNSAVSRARATGMWQFMKGTGKLYGLRVDSWVDERRDPIRSTDAAARHLADLRDRFGSMYLAAAAYNAGAGKVNRGLRRLGDDEDEEEENPDATFFRLYDTRFLRRETKDYVPKLIAAALIAKQPERYGFERPSGIAAMAYDSIIVPDATGLDVLARLADTSIAALRELNPHFIRLVTPPRKQAVVRVPLGTGDLVTARYAALEPRSRVSFVEHTIARRETLAGIARSYRVSTRLIADANPGIRTNRLPRLGGRDRRCRREPPPRSGIVYAAGNRSGRSRSSMGRRWESCAPSTTCPRPKSCRPARSSVFQPRCRSRRPRHGLRRALADGRIWSDGVKRLPRSRIAIGSRSPRCAMRTG